MGQRADRQSPVDVMVVLGSTVLPGGIPSPALQRRTAHAIHLFKQGRARRMIVSGGLGRHPPAEADVMQRLAVANGLPETRIIKEPTAASTMDSAWACARIIRRKRWSSVLIVSDRFHLPRAVLLFRLYGIRASTSAPPVNRKVKGSLAWWYAHARELLSLPWNVLRFWGHRAIK